MGEYPGAHNGALWGQIAQFHGLPIARVCRGGGSAGGCSINLARALPDRRWRRPDSLVALAAVEIFCRM